MMFKNVVVRRPARSLIDGITSAPELGKPDYELAIKQHDAYIEALKSCGVEVTVLPAMEEYPDSCFIEEKNISWRLFVNSTPMIKSHTSKLQVPWRAAML